MPFARQCSQLISFGTYHAYSIFYFYIVPPLSNTYNSHQAAALRSHLAPHIQILTKLARMQRTATRQLQRHWKHLWKKRTHVHAKKLCAEHSVNVEAPYNQQSLHISQFLIPGRSLLMMIMMMASMK